MLLRRLEEGVAQARAIARTVDQSNQAPDEWSALSRDAWLPLLEAVGERLVSPEADVASLRPDLEGLVRVLSHGQRWPVYGSLIDSTLNIVDVVDAVASARAVRT